MNERVRKKIVTQKNPATNKKKKIVLFVFIIGDINNLINKRHSCSLFSFTIFSFEGLSWDTQSESLQRYFSRYGEVIDCVVMKNNETGRSRGFG